MTQQITLDLECAQAATFRFEFAYTAPDGAPIDLTGYSASMDVRRTFDSDQALVHLSTSNDRIDLRGRQGVIALRIESQVTAAFAPGSYRYDLMLRGPSETIRLMRGLFIVDASATRP